MCWWRSRVPKPTPDQTITLNVNFTAPGLTGIGPKLDQILSQLAALTAEEAQVAVDLSDLQAKVARNTDVDSSAVTLLQGLKAKIDELIANSGNTVDPAQLQALSDAIGTSSQSLADAVTANTPAA